MDRERHAKAQLKRDEIREYIQNERDTVLKKWMALEERVKNEDMNRKYFYKKRAEIKTRDVPVTVQKFLGSLKKNVKDTMRYKGGTPYSIVRGIFLYWDSAKKGTLTPEDLHKAMTSLGVKMSVDHTNEVVEYYKAKTSDGEVRLDYKELLEDLNRDEPSIITEVLEETETEEEKAMRFQTEDDKYAVKPPLIQNFLEAVRSRINEKMVVEGGTPYSHVRHCFLMFDWNYSNALDPDELEKACRLNLNLNVSMKQAEDIVDYYDRKKCGEMDYMLLLKDVTHNTPPLISFQVRSAEEIELERRKMAANPLIPRLMEADPNKTLEMFKRKVKMFLSTKVKASGGSIDNWVREAFLQYDPMYTGVVTRWEDLQGACRRFGFVMTPEECKCIMDLYDHHREGSMEYKRIIDDLLKGEAHFMSDPSAFKDPSEPATGKMPPHVRKAVKKLSVAVNTFARHSKGVAQPRDILHGSLIRFDYNKEGKLSPNGFQEACKALRTGDTLSFKEMCIIVKWFDSDGSNRLDIELCTNQLAGSDCLTRPISLPALPKHFMNTHLTMTAGDSFGASMMTCSQHAQRFGPMPGRCTKEYQGIRKKFQLREHRVTALQSEKTLLQKKLEEVEEQRKKILAKHHERKAVNDPFAIRK